MENNSKFTLFTLFGILYKKLVWIILAVVLCTSLGLGYSFYQNKTTYTATKPVMFVINVTSTNISAYNDVGLAKVYLPDVAVMIKTPTFVEKANERLDIDSNVSGGAIRVVFTEDSLIFNISYTDVSEEMAKQKLAVIIESARDGLKDYLQASEVTIKEVQNQADITVNKSHLKFGLFGGVIGLVVSVAIIILIKYFDNTAKDKEEIEAITGANIIGIIEDELHPHKSHKRKKKKRRK